MFFFLESSLCNHTGKFLSRDICKVRISIKIQSRLCLKFGGTVRTEVFEETGEKL